jgi:nicotinamidase/pyrazinamidase
MKSALLIVDIQNDFLPGGALGVENGDEVIPVANKLMDHFDLVIATKDWHPATHKSFAANHPWRKPGQIIDLNGIDQILWPIHCVQGSFGAEFSGQLQKDKIEKVFYKGTDPEIDSYSAFFDNGHLKATGLGDYLKEKGVEEIYIVGLATDYCVKYSTLDALKLGFEVHVVIDGVRGIEREKGDIERALEKMKEKGAQIVESEAVMATT